MSRIDEFTRILARLPFVYGRHDCALVLADWWMYLHSSQHDPAYHLRGTYSTEEECCRVLEDHGGLARVVRGIALSVGATRSSDPAPGDVSVVRILDRHWCAIMSSSGRWVMKTGAGISSPDSSSLRVVCCWRIC